MFDALANDARLHLFMEFKPGDVQLVHTTRSCMTGPRSWTGQSGTAAPPAAFVVGGGQCATVA